MINNFPTAVYQVLNPNVNIWLIPEAVVGNIGIKAAIGIGIVYGKLLQFVKIRPPPGP